VLVAEGFSVRVQRLAADGLGLDQFALGLQERGQVKQGHGHLGVIFAQSIYSHRQHLALQGLGFRLLALSCHDFVDNQVRLQLFVLAYNLGNFLRQSMLPQSVRHWTLTTLREKLIKIGAKVVRHSRQIVFQMAEVAVPRELFRSILKAIERLKLATAKSG
jgi:hypothetical protein